MRTQLLNTTTHLENATGKFEKRVFTQLLGIEVFCSNPKYVQRMKYIHWDRETPKGILCRRQKEKKKEKMYGSYRTMLWSACTDDPTRRLILNQCGLLQNGRP